MGIVCFILTAVALPMQRIFYPASDGSTIWKLALSSMIVFMGTFAIMVVWDRSILTSQASNATLTCKCGHKGRVWIDHSGWGGWYYNTYRIGGADTVTIYPRCCPKCGAEWERPKRHKGHKNKEHKAVESNNG